MELLDKVQSFVSEHFKDQSNHRYQHILGVVDMAKQLAKIYHADESKAAIAAYMHDYCKFDTVASIECFLSDEEKKECEEFPFLYHAYGSAYVYKTYFNEDKDIFNAIYNHVFGRPSMSLLEKIIMISDYTEVGREYESCIECRRILFEDGIDAAILYSLKRTIEFVEKKGDKPHPRQLMVYKEYLEKVGK